MGNALITRKGGLGEINFTSVVLAKNNTEYTITTDRDYDIIVISNSSSGKRGAGAAGDAKIEGYTALSSLALGNYGFNASLGKENDQAGIQYIYSNVKAGATITVTISPGFFTSFCVGIYID